jgi:hypothetical protein
MSFPAAWTVTLLLCVAGIPAALWLNAREWR